MFKSVDPFDIWLFDIAQTSIFDLNYVCFSIPIDEGGPLSYMV